MTKWSTHAHGRGITGIPPTDHIQKFQRRYEPTLRRWLDRFFDNWIGIGNSKSEDRSAVRPAVRPHGANARKRDGANAGKRDGANADKRGRSKV